MTDRPLTALVGSGLNKPYGLDGKSWIMYIKKINENEN